MNLIHGGTSIWMFKEIIVGMSRIMHDQLFVMFAIMHLDLSWIMVYRVKVRIGCFISRLGFVILIARLNSEKFQNFYFQAKIVIFLMKITKKRTMVNSRIFTNTPKYDSHDFPENGHLDNGDFCEKFQKSYIGWIRKNPRIHPTYHFSIFPSKMII